MSQTDQQILHKVLISVGEM